MVVAVAVSHRGSKWS